MKSKCLSETDENSEISRVSVGSEKQVFGQFLANFLTSSDSKNFSMGVMIMFKVSKRFS